MADITIQVLKDGPYLVKGAFDLKDSDGNAIPVDGETCALCRCGQTSNKPFCDGTHAKVGFKD